MTIPFATGLEIQNDWSLFQFRHRSLSRLGFPALRRPA
ncbi:hypothetical protein HNQ71_002490 [Mesorhizobium sangaii]|uniref:Uncharacterized protein n=1 Tax=Mesorhizobium sangaii TaxID=505389 RepID=A0A841PMZ5_9HYPH|nr:hypothetical protein [Mesorhizobium sangaii]